MYDNLQSDAPLFVQIAEMIESAILSGALEEETQAPSTTEISVGYKVNPATALKGVTMLADEGILYKKRGVGMFVASGARQAIREKRKKLFNEKYVRPLLSEAKKLSVPQEEIIDMIRRGYLE